MSWSSDVEQQYESARRKWREANPDQSNPSFWELDFAPSESDIALARRAVANAIQHNVSCPWQSSILILLYLLRTQLSEVRLNRLWPEVARVLSVDDVTVDPARCGSFFRTILNGLHHSELPWVHNRFVAWCLDQAAVGSDRAAIVAEFLAFLLDRVFKYDTSDPAGVVACSAVDDFLALRSTREEIEVYKSHLQRTGRTVVALVRVLRTGEAFHELGVWDWRTLRDWWRARTGEDLSRLTPETGKVLSTLVAGWKGHVSRSSLHLFVSRTGVQVEGCRVAGSDAATDPFKLLLGPVRLGTGSQTRHLQLCDDFGLTVDQIMQYRPDCWYLIGHATAFAWSRDPFFVQWNDGTSERSNPFFVGVTVDNAQYTGSYWASIVSRGALPEIVGKTFASSIKPRLQLRCEWTLRKDGLYLHLQAFAADFVSCHAEMQLLIDKTPRWNGSFNNTLRAELDEPIICKPAIGSDPCVELMGDDGEVLCCTTVPSPGNADAFLAVDGRIQESRTVELPSRNWDTPAPFPAGVILGVATRQVPEAAGGALEQIDSGFSIPGMHRFRLWRLGHASECVQVTIGPHCWELVDTPPLELVEPRTNLSLEGEIDVVAAGRILLVTSGDPVCLRLPETWLTRAASTKGEFRLVVRAAGQQLRWTGAEVVAHIAANETNAFSLTGLTAQTRTELPCGLLRIHLERPHIGSSEPLYVFRCPQAVTPNIGTIGAIPELELRWQEQVACRVRAYRQLATEDLQNGVKSEGWLDFGVNGTVGFRWIPKVADVVLCADGRAVSCDELICASDLHHKVELLVYGDPNRPWTVSVGNVRRDVCVGERCDIGLLVQDVLGDSHNRGDRISVAACCHLADNSVLSREWHLDLRPGDIDLKATWRSTAHSWQVDLDVRLNGFIGVSYEAEVRNHQGLLVASTTIEPAIPEAVERQCVMQQCWHIGILIDASLTRWLDYSEPGTVSIKFGSEMIGQLALPSIPDDLAQRPLEIDTRSAIRSLLEVLGSPPECDDERMVRIVSLCELHVRNTDAFPFRNFDAFLNRLLGHGSVTVQQQAIACLRLLNALAGPSAEVFISRPFQSEGLLALMLATLVTVHQSRLLKLGRLDPDCLRECHELFNMASEEARLDRDRGWAKVMAAYTDRIVGRSRTDIVGHMEPEMMAKVRSDPLVGVDKELNAWLRDVERST